ncbi:MAG: glycoside hydrolase family 1 protein [Propionibacteriaceae bacterium]|jgi:beta-glucosidase|nr:glycoside hydrolase family 1 protein [Propionibacteriaceae bacterium]
MKLDLGSLELGVATAATQIEGGNVDTNWHRWAASPGKVKDGSTPARAVDHWNRVDEDIALLKEMGIRHYRMGVEWARVEPEEGAFDSEAIKHYRDEVKALRKAGITPLVTLHHFNNPGWLEDRGAWTRPDTVAVFLRYVSRMVHALKDHVDEWITINEPNVYPTQAYVFGDWPPGHTSIPEAMTVMSLLAHAHIRAYRLIHAIQPEAKVGVAQHLRPFDPANPYNPADIAGAKSMEYLFQGAIYQAMAYGRFKLPLKGASTVTLGKYYDFIGVNYYTRSWVSGVSQGTKPGSVINDLGWEIYPRGLTRMLAMVAKTYPGPVYITENGTPDAADSFRARFLYDHIKAAVDAGVQRYYHWCFTDNWEWIEGEVPRFGLVEVDYGTQKRTIRESGRMYADMIAHGGLTEEAYTRWVEPSGKGSGIEPEPKRYRRPGPPPL